MNTDITDEELLGWAEGRLDEAAEARLRAAAERDPELAAALGALEASRLPYGRALAAPPIPAALRAQVGDWTRRAPADRAADRDADLATGPGGDREGADPHVDAVAGRRAAAPDAGFRAGAPPGSVTALPARRGASAWLAAAACLVASFVAGHLLTAAGALDAPARTLARLLPGADGEAPSTPAPGAADAAWVERVADYQSLYVPETVGGASGGIAAGRRTLDAVTRETGLATGIPDLSGLGYAFARAQRLGYEGEPLVQLVYTAPGKLPLALCHMPREGGGDAPLITGERSGLATASWAAAGQRFVLVGEESPERLARLRAAASSTWL